MQEIILAIFENPVLFLVMVGLIIAGTYALFARNHAKAQELINSDHVKQNNKIDAQDTKIKELGEVVSDQALAFAEERSSLNNRIKSLETELSSIRAEQTKLIELHTQTQEERDAARAELAHKEVELQAVRRQVETLSRQVDTLTGEIHTLRQTIEQKETQLRI